MNDPLSNIEYRCKPLSACSRDDLLSLVLELLTINDSLSHKLAALEQGYCAGYTRARAVNQV